VRNPLALANGLFNGCLRLRVAAVLAVCLATIGMAAVPQIQWRRIDSPNFIIIGEGGGGDLRDLAVRFEGFREMLGRVLNVRVTQTPVPTFVVAFAYDRSFTPFKPMFDGKRVEAAGVFVPRNDVNYIAMVHDGQDTRMRIVLHEYAHVVLENTGQRLPLWLDEGLAEYYSTFVMSKGGKEATLGGLIGEHLTLLATKPLLTLPELLSVDAKSPQYNEGDRRSLFYAQSWALTHLLLLGEPSRTSQLTQYLDLLAKGVAPLEAWQTAFGTDDIIRELGNYVRRKSLMGYLFRFSEGVAKFEAPVVPITTASREAYLADLLVEVGQQDAGATRLAAATKVDPNDQTVRVLSAKHAISRNDFAGAAGHLAAVQNVSDWYLSYLAGVAVTDLALARGAPPSPEDLSGARQFFAGARVNRREFPNAAARIAALELQTPSGPSSETRIALESARSIAPGRYDYAWLLARLLVNNSEYAAARDVLGPLMSSRYPDEVREAAKSLMGQLLEREQKAESLRPAVVPPSSPATPPPPPVATTPPAATKPPEPATPKRPVFRQIQAGEERFQGLLERVECLPDRTVRFHVQATVSVITVTAPALNAVQFLSYRDDFNGNVQCGRVMPAMPVYVTWRKGKTPGSRLAVAIEFLLKGV